MLLQTFAAKAKALNSLNAEAASEPGRVAELWAPMTQAAQRYDTEAARISSVFEQSAKTTWLRRNAGAIALCLAVVVAVVEGGLAPIRRTS